MAAPPDGDPAPVIPVGPRPAQQTSTRRAVATLRKAGLITLAKEKRRVSPNSATDTQLLGVLGRKYAVLRYAWRTPLGEEIVGRYRAELVGGERIRWSTSLEGARDAALTRCPDR